MITPRRRWIRQRICFSLLAVLGVSSASYAQSVFSNAITGSDPGQSNPYTAGQVVAPNLTVTGIGRVGLSGSAGDDRYNASAFTKSVSVDTSQYFTFTLTPDAGYSLNLISLVYTGTRSGTGPSSFAFRSSADNFASNIGTPTASGTTINLGAAAYQNLIDSIEFRFYGYNASGMANPSPGTFSVNDFSFNGTIQAAPEPMTAGLFCLASCVLLCRRGRSRAGATPAAADSTLT